MAQARPKLAVWKFASCDGCQLSLLDCEDELLAVAGAVEIANFPEASRAVVKGPLRPVAGRGIDHHPARCRADPQGPPDSPGSSSRSAPAPRPAGSRRCGTSRTCGSSSRSSTPTPEYIETLERVHPDRRPRARRLRAAGLPDQQGPAARGARRRSCTAARAQHPHPQRLRRVQAAGQRLRDGGPRHALSRAGDAGRLRSDLPGLSTGAATAASVPMETPNTDVPRGPLARRWERRAADLVRAFRTYNAVRRPPSASESEAMSRQEPQPNHQGRLPRPGRGRGGLTRAGAGRQGRRRQAAASSSRRGSSRRSCGGEASARRPTSPPASAASARSPTR